jgi:TRAP-type mannitol/chloroaromatic compound transport system substrate-binding protein
MKRRDVLKGGVAAALASGAAAVSAPALAAKNIEITMVSTWPRDFPGLGTGSLRVMRKCIMRRIITGKANIRDGPILPQSHSA